MNRDQITKLTRAFVDALWDEITPSTLPAFHVLVDEARRESLEQTTDDAARTTMRVLERLDELYARAVAGGASGVFTNVDKLHRACEFARYAAPLVWSTINAEKEAKQ